MQYYSMTWREFELASQGYNRSMDVKRELNLEGWRQARLMAFYAAAPYLEKHTSITDFMKLPGDPIFDKESAEIAALAKIQEYKDKGWLKATA